MKRFLLVAGSYLLVIVLVLGKSLNPPANSLIFGDDIHRVYYFYREFFNYFLSQGIFPWWNPYLFGGEPFIANPVVNIWYPPTWLFTILPLNLAYSLHLALHIFIAMTGMYWLLKRVMGVRGGIGETRLRQDYGGQVGETGAWAGGLIFGLSGFFMARIWAGHVDVIAAASWMPWVVGAFVWVLWGKRSTFIQENIQKKEAVSAVDKITHVLRFVKSHEERKAIVLAGIVFAIQLYAGYQTMAFFTLEAIGIVTLLHCLISKSLRSLGRVLLAGVLGLGLAGLQIIPEQEFFRSSIRTYALPYSWNSYGAATLESLKQLVNPFYFGDQLTYHGPPPNYPEHAMYVGLAALVLAGFALLKSFKGLKLKKESLPIIGFAAVTIFGLWMSLGPNAPFDLSKLLWDIAPMYRYLRIPARHLILFVFGLSALAGIGLAKIREIRVIGKIGEMLVIGFILWELVPFGQHFMAVSEIPETRHDAELVKILASDTGNQAIKVYRVLQNFGVWMPERDTLDFDSVMSYRIFSATGYDPSILKSYYEYFARASGKSGNEAVLAQDVQVPYLTADTGDQLDFLNIKYLMVPSGYDPFAGSDRYRLLFEDTTKDYRLYENTTVLPRFYLADRSCGRASISSYTPNRIELNVESLCDTKLMSSEVWYPGWVALVDGKKSAIDKTNNIFRTLFVSKGKHLIIYQYSPRIFAVGGVISLMTLLALIGWSIKKFKLLNLIASIV